MYPPEPVSEFGLSLSKCEKLQAQLAQSNGNTELPLLLE
jgi:hypothetical protein